MRKIKLAITLFLIGFNIFSASSQKKIVIPFQLTKFNNIIIKGVLNQQDSVNLMFHTAASSLTLTEEATKRMKSLIFDGADSVKSWGGNGNTSRFSKSNTLQIGQMKWEKVPLWENTNSGPQSDGKFGLELFANKVVEIDFDQQLIKLHDQIPNLKGYQSLKINYKDEMMFINGDLLLEGDDVSIYHQPFLIHSGYSGAVLVDDQLAAKYGLETILKIIQEQALKDSFGNVLKTRKAILPGLYIGPNYFKQIPLTFFSGALGRQKISVIGGDLIKRFNIIIDAKRENIYLKPNKLMKSEYWKG